jgi:hypothetical protein
MHTVELDNSSATSQTVTFGHTRVSPVPLPNGFTLGRTMPNIIREDELFFWTPEWQAGELASEEDYRVGRFRTFDSVDDAIAHLLRG